MGTFGCYCFWLRYSELVMFSLNLFQLPWLSRSSLNKPSLRQKSQMNIILFVSNVHRTCLIKKGRIWDGMKTGSRLSWMGRFNFDGSRFPRRPRSSHNQISSSLYNKFLKKTAAARGRRTHVRSPGAHSIKLTDMELQFDILNGELSPPGGNTGPGW